MKNNQILAGLTGVFFLCSVVTFFNVWNYRSALKRMSQMQNRVAYVRTVVGPTLQSLLNDTTEYSKKNPAVVPILQALTNNMSASGRTAAAATKPATR